MPLRLTAGGSSVTIDVERGGRLAAWSVEGRQLLVGPTGPDDRSIRWGCFLMAPWAGRLADARARGSDGRMVEVPRTHGRHAIHGLLWDRAWTVEAATEARALLTCAIDPATWPPGGLVRHEVHLGEDRLDLTASVTAAPAWAGRPAVLMPAALGWHPWFPREAGQGTLALRLDAAATLATERMIPTGETVPVRGHTDLRAGPTLGRRRLDHAYVAGRAPAVLRWQDLELVITWDPSPTTLVVHTPPDSVCVEPQTAWPNAAGMRGAAREGSGLRMLGPGERLSAAMSIAVRRPGDAGSGA